MGKFTLHNQQRNGLQKIHNEKVMKFILAREGEYVQILLKKKVK